MKNIEKLLKINNIYISYIKLYYFVKKRRKYCTTFIFHKRVNGVKAGTSKLRELLARLAGSVKRVGYPIGKRARLPVFFLYKTSVRHLLASNSLQSVR